MPVSKNKRKNGRPKGSQWRKMYAKRKTGFGRDYTVNDLERMLKLG